MGDKEYSSAEKKKANETLPKRFVSLMDEIRAKRKRDGLTERSDGANEPSKKPWNVTNTVNIAALVITTLATIAIACATIQSVSVSYTQARILGDQEIDGRIEQRAFVGIREIEVTPISNFKFAPTGKTEPGWQFVPVVENSGSTPTVNLEIYCTAFVPSTYKTSKNGLIHTVFGRVRTGPLQSFSFTLPFRSELPRLEMPYRLQAPPDPAEGIKPAAAIRTALVPHGASKVGGIGIRTDDLIASARESHQWFVDGVIFYNDTFPHSASHITKYCYIVTPYANGRAPTISFCRHWNCADGECTKDKASYEKEVRAFTHDPQNYNPLN